MLNLVIFSIISISLFSYYFIKKRIDAFLIFSFLIIAFFYPILFFDIIYLYTTQLNVSIKAKILLLFSILFILFFGLVTKRRNNYNIQVILSLEKKIFIFFLVFIEFLIFIIIFIKAGFIFLIYHDKHMMTLLLGKLEPIYHIFSILFIITILSYRIKKLYFFVFIVVLYDILLGFRLLMFVTLLGILINNQNLKIFKFILFGFLGFIAIILIKETRYFTRDISVVIELYKHFIENPGFYLMIFNSESSSISAVFNEVVKHNFLIPPYYYLESFFKIFPFLEMKGYADYFKGVLFGSEGDSFASGMFSVSYSFLGVFTYFIFLLFIVIFLSFYENRLKFNNIIEIRALADSILLAVIFYHVFRSDLMAIIIYIRSFIVFILVIFLLKILLLQFRKQKASYAGNSVLN